MATFQISSRRGYSLAALLAAGTCLAACATPQPRLATRLPDPAKPQAHPAPRGGGYKVGAPYQVGGVWYVPREDPRYDAKGVASWYGDQFHMRKTANGEVFDMHSISAAHTTLPLPSIVEVTNLDNGRKLQVRVNDRGPFVGGRVIDLSREAARQLGYDQKGLANVRVRYVGPAPLLSDRTTQYTATAPTQTAYLAPPPVTQMSRSGGYAPYAAPPAYAPYSPAYSPAGDQMRTAPQAPVVSQTVLPPVTKAASMAAAAPSYSTFPAYVTPNTPRVSIAAPATRTTYRIQAGSFGDPGNAQRAFDTLTSAGADAVIETADQNGATVYRVMVQAANDENKAYALREMVAGYGFFDARVIRPN